jgi:AcrR family transcriptional regulator
VAVSERAELPWWSKGRVLRQRTLSVERIVEAALTLVDRDGLEGLSMRRLGTDLAAGATSIYWHVPNKDALLDLIVDRLMEETAAELRVQSGTTWRSQLASYALALRTVLERHAAAAPLLGARMPIGPNGLRVMERVLGVLDAAGFSGRQRALAYGALTGYCVGQAVMQARRSPTDPEGPTANGEHLRRLGTLLKDAPRGRYPHVFAGASDIAGLTDVEQFEYGLQRMLDGLEGELRPVNPRRRLF